MADSKAVGQAVDTDGDANSAGSLLPKAEKEISRVWNRGAKAQIRTSFGGGPSLNASKRRAGVAFLDVDENLRTSSPDGQQTSSKATSTHDEAERRLLSDDIPKVTDLSEKRAPLVSELEPNHSLVKALSSASSPDDAPDPRTKSPSEPDKNSVSARSSLSEGEIEESESDHSQILINYASADEQETDDVIARHSDSNNPHTTTGGEVNTKLNKMGHVTSLPESDQRTERNGTNGHPNRTLGSDLTLDKLPLAYQQLQHRYFPRAESEDVPLSQQLVICLVCQGTGHIGATCPKLICSACGTENDHFLSACPTLQICVRCRTKGHQESACSSKLKFSKKADGNVTCSHCSSAHFEEDCPKVFQSYHVPSEASILKVDALPITCYACGSGAHYGADCSYRPRKWTEPKSGWTFSLKNMKLYLNPGSSLHSLEIPPPKTNGAYYVEESTEEENLPLRSRGDQLQRKPRARINSKIHLKSNGPSASSRGRAHHHEPQSRGRDRGGSSRGRGQRRPNGPGHPGPRAGAVYKPSRNDAKKAWQQFTR